MKDQDLLFSDFSDGSNVVEEGAEYNKVRRAFTFLDLHCFVFTWKWFV